MNFVIGKIQLIEVVFPQALEVAQIRIANRVALAKGRSLELAGANLGDIMGQLRANGFCQCLGNASGSKDD
jgi:hypothetical protein